MRVKLTPATLLSGAALFFALGGSALAVSHAVRPQARCATGAVRGVAAVTGETNKGMANVPDQFSSSRSLFSRAFNCAGGSVQVRRVGLGVYDVRFPGNGATSAVVSASGSESWLTPMADGSFRVGMHVPGRQDSADSPFVVVAF